MGVSNAATTHSTHPPGAHPQARMEDAHEVALFWVGSALTAVGYPRKASLLLQAVTAVPAVAVAVAAAVAKSQNSTGRRPIPETRTGSNKSWERTRLGAVSSIAAAYITPVVERYSSSPPALSTVSSRQPSISGKAVEVTPRLSSAAQPPEADVAGVAEVVLAEWGVEAEVVSAGLADVVGGEPATLPSSSATPSHPHSMLKVVSVARAAAPSKLPVDASDARAGYLGYCESVGVAAGPREGGTAENVWANLHQDAVRGNLQGAMVLCTKWCIQFFVSQFHRVELTSKAPRVDRST